MTVKNRHSAAAAITDIIRRLSQQQQIIHIYFVPDIKKSQFTLAAHISLLSPPLSTPLGLSFIFIRRCPLIYQLEQWSQH